MNFLQFYCCLGMRVDDFFPLPLPCSSFTIISQKSPTSAFTRKTLVSAEAILPGTSITKRQRYVRYSSMVAA